MECSKIEKRHENRNKIHFQLFNCMLLLFTKYNYSIIYLNNFTNLSAVIIAVFIDEVIKCNFWIIQR